MLPLEQAYSKEAGQQVNFSNPDSIRKFSQWLIGLVDDNTLLIKLQNLGFDAPVEPHLEVARACLGFQILPRDPRNWCMLRVTSAASQLLHD